MSHYIAVVADEADAIGIQNWVQRYAGASDLITHADLAGGATLTLVTSAAADGVRGREYFAGVAIDHEAREIGFGADGWGSMSRRDEVARTIPLGGRFVSLSWTDSHVSVDRDFSASIPVLTTQGQGWVAISDSLLLLSELRRAMGERVLPNNEVVLARQRTLAIAFQTQSPETTVQGVRHWPPGLTPRIETGGSTAPRVLARSIAAAPQPVESPDEYRATLRQLATQIVGQAVAIDGVTQELSLSGGQDSRLVLAAYRRAKTLPHIQVTSRGATPTVRPDFEVATRLAADFGFELNQRRTRAVPRVFCESGLPLWASSHLGNYDRFLPGKSGVQNNSIALILDGTGAEILKGNYGWRSLADLDTRYHHEITDHSPDAPIRREALLAQLKLGMETVGIDPSDGTASERHYATYRSGPHGAANIPMTLLSLRLAQHPLMLALAYVKRDAPEYEKQRLRPTDGIADLLALIDPQLASAPFLNPSKNRTRAEVESLRNQYGGPPHGR